MLWKKTLYYCPLFVCLIVDLTLAVPLMETQTASSDTYISLHGGLGGPNQPHGSDDRMFLIGPVGQFQACPLLMFDLSNFEGDIPSNDIELQLEVVGSHSGGAKFNQGRQFIACSSIGMKVQLHGITLGQRWDFKLELTLRSNLWIQLHHFP